MSAKVHPELVPAIPQGLVGFLHDQEVGLFELVSGLSLVKAFELMSIDIVEGVEREMDARTIRLPMVPELAGSYQTDPLGKTISSHVGGNAKGRDGLAQAYAVGKEGQSGLLKPLNKCEDTLLLLGRGMQTAIGIDGKCCSRGNAQLCDALGVERSKQPKMLRGLLKPPVASSAPNGIKALGGKYRRRRGTRAIQNLEEGGLWVRCLLPPPLEPSVELGGAITIVNTDIQF